MKQRAFFAQSYQDALRDFQYACETTKTERWDYIVLTAANQRQADSYKLQIDKRRQIGSLPRGTRFMVIPDYKDQRVGSGGATLHVMAELTRELGIDEFLKQKILVIHSGGDSKRIPQYSACGKLFAPVPRNLPSGQISTLFDEILIIATDLPHRMGSGMMIFPSDTELLFNSLQADLLSCDAAGLSMKAPVMEGQEHGVFVQSPNLTDGRNHGVAKFLHKQPERVLRMCGAVDQNNQVDIDTGCIYLGANVLSSLLGLITKDGVLQQEQFESFVNPKVCLNFYTDFVYPLAQESTQKEYLEQPPENGFSRELTWCREILWKTLHPYRISLVKMMPSRYIHFGMTNELYNLFVSDIDEYDFLGWKQRLNTTALCGTVLNTLVNNCDIPENCYIENCVLKDCTIGEGAILSNICAAGKSFPPNVVFHGLKLKDGNYVCRVYGKEDNPKDSGNGVLLGSSVDQLISITGCTKKAVWGDCVASIWNAAIYPVCHSMEEAVDWALDLYRLLQGEKDGSVISSYHNKHCHSLNSSFQQADVKEILRWESDLAERVSLALLERGLEKGDYSKDVLSKHIGSKTKAKNILPELVRLAAQAKFPMKMRLYLAAADMIRMYTPDTVYTYEEMEQLAYQTVRETIQEAVFNRHGMVYPNVRMVKEYVEVQLPVRVNFCGSPSDAAPYCLEHGGTMLDGTLLLKDLYPIRVTIRRIQESEIHISSTDQGQHTVLNDLNALCQCGDPFDPYALHKAVLVATGFLPREPNRFTMEEFCNTIGGGIEISTSVDVPKGSGLGTSSILAAAAVQAINELCGIQVTPDQIYAQVFLVEQLMNTGGGWQDQVGGLTRGIKYFISNPGVYQEIQVEHLNLSKKTMEELNQRFALIFSGQRRLARNVLREEMNQCIRNHPGALKTVREIEECCAKMRHHLIKGNITRFAQCVTRQFELVKTLDKGASNTCIEYIFDVCEDLIDGKSICGAGGGGFLQVILKPGVSKEMLNARIMKHFFDCGVELWDCTLI